MSLPGSNPIAALDQLISQHLSSILNTAYACPPGGNRSWNDLLAYYGVVPEAPAERLNTSRDLRMTRGAIPAEVGRVLDGLQRWAQGQLQATYTSPGIANTPQYAALIVRIQGLSWQERKRYEEAVIPRKEPSVGSIFANASSTAAETPWANVRVEPANVLVCWSCGAPQEKAMNFTCRYCSQPLGGPSQP